jgi:hypothetical protein
MMRRVPPASPGIAASQNNCSLVNVNPIPGSFVTIALIMNHVANDSVKVIVVTQSVRHPIRFPVFSQKVASSGFQVSIHVVERAICILPH